MPSFIFSTAIQWCLRYVLNRKAFFLWKNRRNVCSTACVRTVRNQNWSQGFPSLAHGPLQAGRIVPCPLRQGFPGLVLGPVVPICRATALHPWPSELESPRQGTSNLLCNKLPDVSFPMYWNLRILGLRELENILTPTGVSFRRLKLWGFFVFYLKTEYFFPI